MQTWSISAWGDEGRGGSRCFSLTLSAPGIRGQESRCLPSPIQTSTRQQEAALRFRAPGLCWRLRKAGSLMGRGRVWLWDIYTHEY